MKKMTALLAASALAFTSTPAFAGGDTGEPLPNPDEFVYEVAVFMCNLTGLDLYCDYVEKNKPKPEPSL